MTARTPLLLGAETTSRKPLNTRFIKHCLGLSAKCEKVVTTPGNTQVPSSHGAVGGDADRSALWHHGFLFLLPPSAAGMSRDIAKEATIVLVPRTTLSTIIHPPARRAAVKVLLSFQPEFRSRLTSFMLNGQGPQWPWRQGPTGGLATHAQPGRHMPDTRGLAGVTAQWFQ